MPLLRNVLVTVLVLVGSPALGAENWPEYILAHYTKYEYKIPMRDGKKLHTAVFVPKDDSKTYPILMTRTPYSCKPYGVDEYPAKLGPSTLFIKAGYIFVKQDVRGRWMSEGTHVNMRPHLAKKNGPDDFDESTDTYDTIDWLLKNVKGHNGKVGQWGISYPGFYTAAGMIDAHPALKAVTPQAPIVDWFVGDDWHHNGAFQMPHAFNFLARFGRPRPEPVKKFEHVFDYGTEDGYDFYLRMGPLPNANKLHFKDDVAFWKEVMAHGNYDEFWQARNLRPHLKNIKPAVMTVGGWYDAENLFGAMEVYRNVEATSGKNTNLIVMGPWRHGGWNFEEGTHLGDVKFNAKTSLYYQEKIEFPFFEYHLKNQGSFNHPEAWMFETGTNQWRKYETWPPRTAQAKTLYLREKGELAFEPPASVRESFDEYTSDPARPVPYLDRIVIGMDYTYMTADQRFAARRPDVLVYQTEVLERDLTLAGPIKVTLHVSTTGTDADFIVKLIDVYPDDYPDPKPNPKGVRMGGYQQLVRGDVMRGKFRKSLSKPEAFVPGEPAEVSFLLQDAYHCFRPGHRLMVQVQSSWFPLIDRNPQTFVDIYNAKESDFQKSTQRVYRSKELPSRLEVRVLP
ncbi:MAG: CocE/NonD family hydrolase [Gemmataceae bacterium]